jgi:hypothetical protein
MAQDIQGAGSSAAAPLYQLWADAFGKAKGSKIAYQASGSSSGIRQIKEAKLISVRAMLHCPLPNSNVMPCCSFRLRFPVWPLSIICPVSNLRNCV